MVGVAGEVSSYQGFSVKLRARPPWMSSTTCLLAFQEYKEGHSGCRPTWVDECGSAFLKPFMSRSAGLRFMNVVCGE